MDKKELEKQIKQKSILTLLERKDIFEGMPPCLENLLLQAKIKEMDKKDFINNLGFFLKIKYGEENFDYILNDICEVLFNKKPKTNDITRILKIKKYDCNCQVLLKNCKASICNKIKKTGCNLNRPNDDCCNLLQEIKIEDGKYYIKYDEEWLYLPDASYLLNKNVLSKFISNKLITKCVFKENVYMDRIKKLVSYAKKQNNYIQEQIKKELYTILKNKPTQVVTELTPKTYRAQLKVNKKRYIVIRLEYIKFIIEKKTNLMVDKDKIHNVLGQLGFNRKKEVFYGKDYYFYKIEVDKLKLSKLFS